MEANGVVVNEVKHDLKSCILGVKKKDGNVRGWKKRNSREKRGN